MLFAQNMKKKTHLYLPFLMAFVCCLTACQKNQEIRIVATGDVHGNFYPYDFIKDTPATGSLARVETYLKEQRAQYGKRLAYLDNGDILQGQPTAYYYNTVAVADLHVTNAMLNYMGCKAATLGNHDVETGGQTYQRYILDADYTVLGANILLEGEDRPFIPPYKMLDFKGVRVAVIGMVSPAIPNWLPKELWKALEFADMKSTAEKWVAYVKANEKPDMIIGLFHSGRDGGIVTPTYCENATEAIAREVPGFDAIIYGHDHQTCCDTIVNTEGRQVPIINPGSGANNVACLTLRRVKDASGRHVWTAEPELVSVKDIEPDPDFLSTFAPQMEEVKAYVSKRIGTFTESIDSRDAYFGPSRFVDFIHKMQLDITRADISLAAPLTYKAVIPAGDVYVRDMFNLYKFENMLYTMFLTGQEIKDHLEMSYDQWIHTMSSPNDHLLRFKDAPTEDNEGWRLQHTYYSFDSAAGIQYEVDVTRPAGQRVHILSMANGTPFDLTRTYRVAVNSYRGNGGGELLTRGAGIPREELSKRIDYSTDADLRFFMLNYIEMRDTVTPTCLNQWKFVPESYAAPAAARDYELLFGQP